MSLPPLNYKKILLTLGFTALVVAMAYGIYWFFFKPPPKPPIIEVPEEVRPPARLPEIREAEIRRIREERERLGLPAIEEVPPLKPVEEIAQGEKTLVKPVLEGRVYGLTLGPDGASLYYNKEEGKFYRQKPGEAPELLVDQKFYEVEKITWASGKDKAILEYPDDSNILYNFETKKQYTLPKEMQDFSFSPQDNKIAFEYIGSSPEERWLATSNPDASEISLIEPLGAEAANVQVSWSPAGQIVAMFRQGVDISRQEVFFLGQYGENFKSLMTDGRGFQGQWSSKGDQLLYSVYNSASNYNPTLYIADAQGENIGLNKRNLGLETWPDKCVFSRDGLRLYCGVPEDLRPGSGLYPQIASSVPDVFYKVDLAKGLKSFLADPVDELGIGSYTVERIFLSPDESKLYFTRRQDGGLYEMRLR